jgi:hypothetical protein
LLAIPSSAFASRMASNSRSHLVIFKEYEGSIKALTPRRQDIFWLSLLCVFTFLHFIFLFVCRCVLFFLVAFNGGKPLNIVQWEALLLGTIVILKGWVVGIRSANHETSLRTLPFYVTTTYILVQTCQIGHQRRKIPLLQHCQFFISRFEFFYRNLVKWGHMVLTASPLTLAVDSSTPFHTLQ